MQVERRSGAVLRPGLVSVTFRQLSPPEVVDWSARAGLEGIEWGGDVHVPHGETVTAADVGRMTRDAGLAVAAYGSYYRLGQEAPEVFEKVLDTAVALGAPVLRIWAGRIGSVQADPAFRVQVAADGRRIAEMAQQAGVRIACEWHGNTLTDTAESATAFFAAVGHRAFGTYWQPRARMPFEECLHDLDATLPRLLGLHVFHWNWKTGQKRPLAEGESVWPGYLSRATRAGSMFALLEFVKGDNPQQMVEDAAVLHRWIDAMRTDEERPNL